MQLHSVLFAGQFAKQHARMANVLRESAAENTPHRLTIYQPSYLDAFKSAPGTRREWLDNAQKAAFHFRIIHGVCSGELLGMLDSDTMILGDLSEIESMDFDLAYTVRPPGSRWKLNTGVYFLRVSENTRQFVERWYTCVLRMLADPAFHQEWKKYKGYGGIHQAALGWMLENDTLGLRLLELPCATWNCASGLWESADNPKIVHVMARMRDWCFGPRQPKSEAEQRLVDLWRMFDERREAVAG